MTEVTTSFLLKKIKEKRPQQRRRKNETELDHLGRMTHLQLQSQDIQHISPMEECPSVLVAYLQNNSLKSIHNMGNFPRLTHLYLQKNQISRIENLGCVPLLRKLYLGYNQISVLEGLESLKNLNELHIEGQKLVPGESLHCDPRSLQALAGSLNVLNISSNNLSSMSFLSVLTLLEILNASDNELTDLKDVVSGISFMRRLSCLQLIGNPVTSDRKYKDTLIIGCSTLAKLDGKPIQKSTRHFIESMVSSKQVRRCQQGDEQSFSDYADEYEATWNRVGSIGSRLFPAWKRYFDNNPGLNISQK